MPVRLEDIGLLTKYRHKGALIDTNLVILFVVGAYNPARISTFNRTRKYLRSDYDLIVQISQWFEHRLTTPNILTEVDNLVRQLPEREHIQAAKTMRGVFATFYEQGVLSAKAITSPHYSKFGLADAVSIDVAADGYLVITDDFPLAGLLESIGRAVLNFNHLRSLG